MDGIGKMTKCRPENVLIPTNISMDFAIQKFTLFTKPTNLISCRLLWHSLAPHQLIDSKAQVLWPADMPDDILEDAVSVAKEAMKEHEANFENEAV